MSFDLAHDPLVMRAGDYVLRPLERGDAAGLLQLFSDPAVVEFMDIEPLADLAQAQDIVVWASERRMQNAGLRWGIRKSGAEGLIGTVGFNALEVDRGRRGEIAYDLARAYWGQGVMAAVLPRVLAFGFERLGLRRVEAMVTLGNERSGRLLEKHGFLREGVLRDHAFWKGRFWDQAVYGRLADATGAAAAPAVTTRDGVVLRATELADAPAVLDLYRAAAAAPGGLARAPEEMDLAYVEGFLRKARAEGVALSIWSSTGEVVGEIHASRMGPRQFQHVLTDLTVAVHPQAQGQGFGRRLFTGLFAEADRLTPKVTRIELMAREGNTEAIRLYERLGFSVEGRFERRVRLPDGKLEADIAMGIVL